MKKIIMCFVLMACSLFAVAQISLENTYNGTLLNVTKLTASATYYYGVNSTTLTLYNINHSVYKTVNFPFVHTTDTAMIYYVSENLFDLDNGVEYMRAVFFMGQYGEAVSKASVKIYDDNGSVLFAEDTVMLDRFTFLNGVAPMIISTPGGTKMIIRKAVSAIIKETQIYNLAGQFYSAVLSPDQAFNSIELSGAYPNPANNLTRVDYKLPQGVNSGELIFCDMNGAVVRKFLVDGAFNNLVLSTNDLDAGTYLYYLQTSLGASEGKKMVVIN